MDEYNITTMFLLGGFSRKERKEQLQRCARAFHADMLRNEGFVSYKGEDLSWYRIINNEVLQSVHIFINSCRWPRLQMGYAAHPLFIMPWLPLGLVPKMTVPWGDEIMKTDLYPYSECIFDEKTPISCPRTDKIGAERLTEVVFPIFREIHTAKDAYLYHKKLFMQQVAKAGLTPLEAIGQVSFSAELGDEVVYFEDKELYPTCLEAAKRGVEVHERHIAGGVRPLNRFQLRDYTSCRLHVAAIEDGKREEFLEEMNLRRNQTVKKLKKVGIDI